ncbi:hypothetical protein RND71_010267 [Anisodus tanguticus]|uniref:Uncharacterized protein n=1 Tax=Anisodus tanguticus TaxID=243964 RepID=A0AAE1VJ00_9SOLA|nr:hypothetical protein RND71_010267 [Anisodus tanguticus]
MEQAVPNHYFVHYWTVAVDPTVCTSDINITILAEKLKKSIRNSSADCVENVIEGGNKMNGSRSRGYLSTRFVLFK